MYLTQKYNKSESFQKLFNDKDKVKEESIYAITKVTYFWYSLYVLKQQGMIEGKIASKLFYYQYSHWINVLEPLYNATIDDGSDIPEWCAMFEKKENAWIEESKIHAVDHVLTKA